MGLRTELHVGDIITTKHVNSGKRRVVKAIDRFCKKPTITLGYLHSDATYQLDLSYVEKNWKVVS